MGEVGEVDEEQKEQGEEEKEECGCYLVMWPVSGVCHGTRPSTPLQPSGRSYSGGRG